jgi:hypothetical protein
MMTAKTQFRYLQWISADEMYDESKKWLSELNFIKDEHLFFDDVIKTYTLQLIDKNSFAENKAIADALSKSQKQNDMLLESIKAHKNEIEILLDGIDQLKEEDNLKKEHKNLILLVSDFFYDYKKLKTKLFKVIKDIMKAQKMRLIERT